MQKVIDNLELLGALVSQQNFDKKIAVEAYSGSTALRCWYVLKGYIEAIRAQRGGLYCKYLEDFAWRTLDYQEKHSPEDEHILFYVDDPNKPFNLIKFYKDNPNLKPKRRI
jgi:hypothetical protein